MPSYSEGHIGWSWLTGRILVMVWEVVPRKNREGAVSAVPNYAAMSILFSGSQMFSLFLQEWNELDEQKVSLSLNKDQRPPVTLQAVSVGPILMLFYLKQTIVCVYIQLDSGKIISLRVIFAWNLTVCPHIYNSHNRRRFMNITSTDPNRKFKYRIKFWGMSAQFCFLYLYLEPPRNSWNSCGVCT